MTPSDFRTKNCWTHDLTNLNCPSELSRDCLQTVGTSCWVPNLQLDRAYVVLRTVLPAYRQWVRHDTYLTPKRALGTGTSCYVPYSQIGSGYSYVMIRTVLPNGQYVQVRHDTYRTPKRAVGTGRHSMYRTPKRTVGTS